MTKWQEVRLVIPWKDNWVQLNIDGAREVESGSPALGRVLRDQWGKWILGYNKCLGNCSIFEGKLCEILDGLIVLLSRRFDRILIQTNSMEAMKAIQIFTKTSLKSALIRQIQQLLIKVGN